MQRYQRALFIATLTLALTATFAPTASAYDATDWKRSVACPGGAGKGVLIQATGWGVLEVQWRLANSPTAQTHYHAPNQAPYIHTIRLDSRERQIAWRAIAYDTDQFKGRIDSVRESCGGFPRDTTIG
jgi:hypothetical protein